MKTALLMLLSSTLAGAATTVTGTISMPDGSAATGRAYIDLAGTCIGSSGRVIVNPTKIVTFNAGAFSVALEPSSTCVPSQVYRVRYQTGGWNSQIEFWDVPATGPTTIDAIRVPGIPVQSGALGVNYITGLTCKGDLISYTGTTTVRVPCPTAPNQVLKYDAAAPAGVSWQAASAGASYGRYSTTISPASTSWSVPNSTHLLNTCALAVQIWVSNVAVEPDTISCNATTFDVTITFASAQTGDVFLTSDPVFVADNPATGSLVSQIVAQAITASPITITHNLNNVVIVRCYDSSNVRIGYDQATRLSANALTVSFLGSPSGFCFVGR